MLHAAAREGRKKSASCMRGWRESCAETAVRCCQSSSWELLPPHAPFSRHAIPSIPPFSANGVVVHTLDFFLFAFCSAKSQIDVEIYIVCTRRYLKEI